MRENENVSIDEMIRKYADRIRANAKDESIWLSNKFNQFKEKASQASTALQPTKKKGVIAAVIVTAFLSVTSLFSSAVGSLKSKAMNDKKFVKGIERTIDEFEEAVKTEDLNGMYGIVRRTEKEGKTYDASDYAMVTERVADALNEKALEIALAEIQAGRVSVNILENLRYASSALKDSNTANELQDAMSTLTRLGTENPIYSGLDESLRNLGETCDETTARLSQYRQDDDISKQFGDAIRKIGEKLPDKGTMRETLKQTVGTVKEDVMYILGSDNPSKGDADSNSTPTNNREDWR